MTLTEDMYDTYEQMLVRAEEFGKERGQVNYAFKCGVLMAILSGVVVARDRAISELAEAQLAIKLMREERSATEVKA